MATHSEIPTIPAALRMFSRVVHWTRPFWGRLTKGIWLGLAIGSLSMAMPWFSKMLIDEAYPRQDFQLMYLLVLGGLAFRVASGLMNGVRSFYTQIVSSHLGSSTDLMFFNHVLHLDTEFFDRHRVGEILSRFGDLGTSVGVVSIILEIVLLRGAYLIFVPPVLLYLNWRLALLALATIPPVMIISTLASRALRRQWKASAEAHADLSAIRMEGLSQVRTIKALGAEHVLYSKIRDQTQDALRLQLRASGLGIGVGVVNGLLNAAGVAILSWYAWTLILSGSLTLGAYFAFMAYLGYVTGPLGEVVGLVSRFQQWAVSLGRTFEYLDEVPEFDSKISESPPQAPSWRLSGEIAAEGVSFAYEPETEVLSDISLEIRPGSVVALVGPSGSGKSTLLKLLAGVILPEKGTIRFGGAPTRIGVDELRGQVTSVWQDTGVLQGTLRENLTLGCPSADDRELDRVVRVCQLTEVVAAQPLGYDAEVGEWGATLSGGQRQRLAIARALLRRTPIILLDEATSNIDVGTELALLRELLEDLEGHTLIYVTHRVSTAALADEVYFLNAGRIVDRGSHEELLDRSADYRQMAEGAETADSIRKLRVIPS